MGSNLYADQIDSVVAIFEGAAAIGLTLGPSIGALFYWLGGFCAPFLAVGTAFAIITPMIFWLVPQEADEEEEDGGDEEAEENQGSFYRELTYSDILSSRRIKFLLLGIMVNLIAYVFLDPILAPYMDDEYGVEEDLVGFIFLAMGFGYLLFCAALPLLSRYLARRSLIHLGCLLNGCTLLFIAPSQTFRIPKSLALSISALTMAGFFCGYAVPLFTEVIEEARVYTGCNSKQFNDLVSGLQNTFFAIGELLGPLIGNYLHHKFSFFTTCDVMAFMTLSYVLFHALSCDIFYVNKPAKDHQHLRTS